MRRLLRRRRPQGNEDRTGSYRANRKCKQACAKAGLRLHKFVSNSELVLNSIAAEDKAESQENLELLQREYPLERALGIQWCVNRTLSDTGSL